MEKEKLVSIDELLTGTTHREEEDDRYIKTENGRTLRPDLLKKSNIEAEFRWNNGGKEIHDKMAIPGFEYTEEYKNYFHRYNDNIKPDTQSFFYEEPVSFDEWLKTAENFDKEAFTFKEDGSIILKDELWQKTIAETQFQWDNGAKEMYEKLQTIPDFYKTEEYKNYRQGFAYKSQALEDFNE